MLPLAIGAAVLGGLAGSQGNRSSQSSTSTVQVAPASKEEKEATSGIQNLFSQLMSFQGGLPGQSDIQAGTQSQRDLATLLQQYAQGGYAPTQADQVLAGQMLAPQQLALQHSGDMAKEQYARNAAMSGRGPNDFTFTNRLNRDLSDMQMNLAAQQSALATQLPGQRLGYQSQLAQVRSGLATQAMQNRTAIAGLGQQIQQSERNFRLATATRTNDQQSTSGGGLKGTIEGALGGAGAGLGIGSLFSSFGGSGMGLQGAASALSPEMAGSFGSSPAALGNNYLGSSSFFQSPMSAPNLSQAFGGSRLSRGPASAPQTQSYNGPLSPSWGAGQSQTFNPFNLGMIGAQ